MLISMKDESWSHQALAGFRACENVFCLEELGAKIVAALCFPAIPPMPILSSERASVDGDSALLGEYLPGIA